MPAPLTLSRVSTTTDIMDQGRFLVLFGSVPGSSDTDGLTIRCFNAVIPGMSTEVMEVPMHGYTLRFRGRRIHTSPATFAFWENSQMDTYDVMYNWLEDVVGIESGNSNGYLADYSVQTQISKFDTAGVEAKRFTLDNTFPQEITDLNLSDESSTPLQVQVQLSYRTKIMIF